MKLGSAFTSLVCVLVSTGCATAVGNPNQGGDAGPQSSKDAGATKDSGTKKVPDSGSSTQDSGTPTNDDSGAPIDDSTCAGLSTRATCEQCCLSVHPSGYGVYHQEIVTCACSTPAACASECASELCANQPTTQGGACEQCITASLTQGTGACYDGVAAACQGDSDCTTLFGTCIPPCESK